VIARRRSRRSLRRLRPRCARAGHGPSSIEVGSHPMGLGQRWANAGNVLSSVRAHTFADDVLPPLRGTQGQGRLCSPLIGEPGLLSPSARPSTREWFGDDGIAGRRRAAHGSPRGPRALPQESRDWRRAGRIRPPSGYPLPSAFGSPARGLRRSRDSSDAVVIARTGDRFCNPWVSSVVPAGGRPAVPNAQGQQGRCALWRRRFRSARRSVRRPHPDRAGGLRRS
jgi:hypothetical protein